MRYLVVIILLMLAGGGYLYFNAESTMKRSTQKALDGFTEAMETKDRAKVGEALQAGISDDAKIKLEVNFWQLTSQGRGVVQNFPDKHSFVQFIDNVLYPLKDYFFQARLRELEPAADHKTAKVSFAAQGWGDGVSLYGGTGVDVRYSFDSTCNGVATFSEKLSTPPVLSQMDCSLQLRTIPKNGQAAKFRDMNAVQDLLK